MNYKYIIFVLKEEKELNNYLLNFKINNFGTLW